MAVPSRRAAAWSRISPVSSGWALAQAAALAPVVKKFTCPQLIFAAAGINGASGGTWHGSREVPEKITAAGGCHVAVSLLAWAVMVTGPPVCGSAEVIVTAAWIIAAMPRASMALIACTRGP